MENARFQEQIDPINIWSSRNPCTPAIAPWTNDSTWKSDTGMAIWYIFKADNIVYLWDNPTCPDSKPNFAMQMECSIASTNHHSRKDHGDRITYNPLREKWAASLGPGRDVLRASAKTVSNSRAVHLKTPLVIRSEESNIKPDYRIRSLCQLYALSGSCNKSTTIVGVPTRCKIKYFRGVRWNARSLKNFLILQPSLRDKLIRNTH